MRAGKEERRTPGRQSDPEGKGSPWKFQREKKIDWWSSGNQAGDGQTGSFHGDTDKEKKKEKIFKSHLGIAISHHLDVGEEERILRRHPGLALANLRKLHRSGQMCCLHS